jgi:tetratricopeptide (TPR) repeat protein
VKLTTSESATGTPGHLFPRLLPFLGLVVAVTAICAVLYGPGLGGPFFFDDFNSLMNVRGETAPQVLNPRLPLQELVKHPLRPDRSLAWLSFAASYHFRRMNPAAFRTVNLVLHGLTALLLYLLLLRLRSASDPDRSQERIFCWPAAAGCLLFLCHPLALNTVLYACQRFGGLATFFYLLGFYDWLKGQEKSSQTTDHKKSRWLWLVLLGAAFWAAVHSKEMAVTLPLTILFYEFYNRDLSPVAGSRRSRWFFILLFIAISAALLLFAWQIGLFNRAWINIGFRSKRLWSPWIQFLSESRAFLHYWKLLLLPLPGSLSLHHEFAPAGSNLDPAGLATIAVHLVILAGAWKIRRSAPLVGFGIFWFYLVLGPPYLLLPQRELLVEYKTYLAAPGVAMIACGLPQLLQCRSITAKIPVKYLKALFQVLFWGWLIFLAATTWRHRAVFSSPVSIWSEVLRQSPSSRRALNNRAAAYLRHGDTMRALKDLNHLLRLHPNYARGYENRGRLKLHLGNYRGAAADLARAIRLLPTDPRLDTIRRQLKALRRKALRKAARSRIRLPQPR